MPIIDKIEEIDANTSLATIKTQNTKLSQKLDKIKEVQDKELYLITEMDNREKEDKKKESEKEDKIIEMELEKIEEEIEEQINKAIQEIDEEHENNIINALNSL